jgi:hypothetical protein
MVVLFIDFDGSMADIGEQGIVFPFDFAVREGVITTVATQQ